jgi:tetratricopeptide (TPR) repeat protein
MNKKLSKEDLEQDLLIEYSSRFVHFYNQNKAVVLGGGLAIILTIVLVIGFFIYSAQQEQEAQVLLGVAEQALMQNDFERALYGDESEFTLGFTQIARNYNRTDAGNLAHYYSAVAEFELGNFEEALSHIEKYRVPRGILGVAPLSMNAIILAELERYEEAARKFERAANWDENNSTTPQNLFEAAQTHIEAGNTQRALEHLNTILREYPNNPLSSRAERMIGQLTISG